MWPPGRTKAAFIMAGTGEAVTYAELDARSNRLAHFLRGVGLNRLDHYAIFMENNARYVECCAAGERSGLYYTCINSFLTADEVAYIVDNSESQVLVFSEAKRAIATEVLRRCPAVKVALIADGQGDGHAILNLDDAVRDCPTTPIADESLGKAMLYSSGTTGRPKGILRPVPDQPPAKVIPAYDFIKDVWRFRDGMTYLSPAPQGGVNMTIRMGGTALIMEHFDPEQYLMLVEKYRPTHSQLVPTMFSRMLKLPQEVRDKYDVSSLEVAIHAAAPCPPQIKEQMIEWWGPVLLEYYSATELLGFAVCDSAEWLSHRGTVGKVVSGEICVLDDDMRPVPNGQPGTLWFKTMSEFSYFNDEEKTAESRTPDGAMTTVGDVGYVDDDGYLYLTDRATFMIISGGVNIYPQETENLLITHPKVEDAAVFGVPNEDLGEEVKAVVQPLPGIDWSPALADELIEFCRQHLSKHKVPRSIDFTAELPRLPTGKLYKRLLRDRYWDQHATRIV
ncbi:AMP-binding protein [Mycolicibacterium sp. 120270]|uniref:AMP-binding protein n=1 Tax=Mycolicibacterium sp. 120270 TaxID=3090600 RepID=UPI00299E211A|nr:AMP-binding protein [Mycolicibacterium sp. 120270]MDX1886125.1 AMP-binding protein [Mycolicibacterium sp. 120270]